VLLVPVLDVSVDVLAVPAVDVDEPNSEIRLCRLENRLPGPLVELTASVEPLELEVLLVPCDCNADIRFCRKLPIACAALELEDDELLESELVELDELPELLESLTPICCRALATAPIRPPPGGGGMLPTVLLESLLPDCVPDWICDQK
jgi:hypothetical protein